MSRFAAISRWRSLWPPIASALLFEAAFPPFNFSLLVFVALVPWIASLEARSGRGAFKSGYVFGLIFLGVQLFWIRSLVHDWTHDPGLSYVPWVLATAIGALYFGGAGWLIHACWRLQKPWLIPIAWAGVEVLRSFILVLAFPWGLAATPLWLLTPMIQTAHYATIYGVSAWVVLANVLGARFLRGDRFAQLRNGAMAFVAVLALSLVRYGAEAEGVPTTITIGQPGVDLAFGDPTLQDAAVAKAVLDLTLSAAAADSALLVLPEGLVKGGAFPPSPPFAVTKEVPVLFGGTRGSGPAYQSAFAFDGEWHYADKTRLVVFGEYVPGRGVLPFLDRFNLPGDDLQPSDTVSAVRVNGLTIGPMLCFEGLFYDVAYKQARNGAQLLAQMSIDDWYMGTAAPDQLRMATPFRAIEAGVPLVRSGSLGYSMAVDARGDIVAQAPLRRQVATTVRLRIPAGPDLFKLLPLFPWLASLSVPGIVLVSWRSRRTRMGAGKAPARPSEVP